MIRMIRPDSFGPALLEQFLVDLVGLPLGAGETRSPVRDGRADDSIPLTGCSAVPQRLAKARQRRAISVEHDTIEAYARYQPEVGGVVLLVGILDRRWDLRARPGRLSGARNTVWL
ncbi:hypothetical protein [Nonomuraea solani]|uniref:hypothetical protein n=1 Tax=Nonomuraea solani TaxID=1144553 RepID=UPI0011AFF6C9|nr:hypothetical protein [Nonomuraea solani]